MNRHERRVFQATKALPEMTDEGKRLMSMAIGESYVRPWTNNKRPESGAEVDYGGITLGMEPTEAGLKITRLK